MLEGKRVMYYNQKGDRHPRGTLELNAGSRLKKIATREHAFHVVSDKQVGGPSGRSLGETAVSSQTGRSLRLSVCDARPVAGSCVVAAKLGMGGCVVKVDEGCALV